MKRDRTRESRLRIASSLGLVSLAAGGMLLAVGCSKENEGPKVIALEGKVERLDLGPDGTGQITVSYRSEKHDQDVVGTARITAETEVMIDGAVATAKDIKLGERVRGDVRVDKKGDERIQTVVKIYVDRPKTEG